MSLLLGIIGLVVLLGLLAAIAWTAGNPLPIRNLHGTKECDVCRGEGVVYYIDAFGGIGEDPCATCEGFGGRPV